MINNKHELRKKFLALRSAQDESVLEKSSEIIIKNLYETEEYKKAQTIMVYVSYRGEVKTHALIKTALKDGKRVCVPLCDSNNCSMTAREIASFSELKSGAYGILEPEDSAPVVDKTEIDFVIVPGCAFSKSGHRIGYGKGYYDRFLKDTSAFKCGLSYDFSFADELPYEETDIPLDMIITESCVHRPV